MSTSYVPPVPDYWRGGVEQWAALPAESAWDHFERAFAAQLLENVKFYKKEEGLTAKALAERLAEAGWPLSVSSINGMLGAKKRKSVSVTEWFALARALRVPPLNLLLPIHSNERVSIHPREEPETVLAIAYWLTGGSDIPFQRDSPLASVWDERSYERALQRLDHLTEHEDVLDEIRAANAKVLAADERSDVPDNQRSVYRLNLNQAVESLRYTIALGQKNGDPLLALPMQLEQLAWDRGQVHLPLAAFNTEREIDAARKNIEMDMAYVEFERERGPGLVDQAGQEFVDWYNARARSGKTANSD